MSDSDMIRVRLRVEDPQSWHKHEQEGVWVKLVQALVGKAIVEICNIPFFCNYLSMGDKITVGLYQGQVMFQSVVERGGHSTYRIFIDAPQLFDLERLKSLEVLGCTWEHSTWGEGDLYALDIPANSNFDDVYTLLEQGKRDGIWICDEGYINHHAERPPLS